MTAIELLSKIERELAESRVLLDTLALEALHHGLLSAESRSTVEELNRSLREASCAAAALNSLSAGNPSPKLG